MAFVRRHVTYRAMTVLAVVPVDEPSDPLPCGVDAGERQTRVCRGVLQGAKQRLGVGVVVRDVRAAEGWDNPEPLERGDQGAGTHGLAVVRVQHQALWIQVALAADLSDELGGDLCGLRFCDSPSDDT